MIDVLYEHDDIEKLNIKKIYKCGQSEVIIELSNGKEINIISTGEFGAVSWLSVYGLSNDY